MFWRTFWLTLQKLPLRINGKFQKIDGPGVHFRKKLHQLPRSRINREILVNLGG